MTGAEVDQLAALQVQVDDLVRASAARDARERDVAGLEVLGVRSPDPAAVLATIELATRNGRAVVGIRRFGGWSEDGFEPFGTAKPLAFETAPGAQEPDTELEDGDEWKAAPSAPVAEREAPACGFHVLTLRLPQEPTAVARRYAELTGGEG